MTIVDQGGEAGTTFSRYVDWSSVMEQLGMYANYRPTIDTGDAAVAGGASARPQLASRPQSIPS